MAVCHRVNVIRKLGNVFLLRLLVHTQLHNFRLLLLKRAGRLELVIRGGQSVHGKGAARLCVLIYRGSQELGIGCAGVKLRVAAYKLIADTLLYIVSAAQRAT